MESEEDLFKDDAGLASSDTGDPGAGPLQANPFEAGEPVEEEVNLVEGGAGAMSRKRKRSQAELLQVFEASGRDLNAALVEFRDEILGAGVYHTLSKERQASVDKAVNSMRWKAYKVFNKKRKLKAPVGDPRFDQTWVNPVDHSGLLSSREHS